MNVLIFHIFSLNKSDREPRPDQEKLNLKFYSLILAGCWTLIMVLSLWCQGELAALGTPQEVINEAVIEAVFDIQTGVDQNPFTHTPRITLRGPALSK